jgi:hypothetical protein
LKQLFYIDQEQEKAELLALQIGEKHLAFALTDRSGNRLKQLAWCIADDRNLGWNETELLDLVHHYPALRTTVKKVRISYQLSDADWKSDYYFYLPDHIKKFTDNHFQAPQYEKQYQLSRNSQEKKYSGDSLFIDFRNEEFTVVGSAGKQLLLAQTYRYETPADVLYTLLKICRHFLFSQDSTPVELSGLIEKQSTLYKELYQYFNLVSFREAGWVSDTGHPAHFFTSLNDLATCAS